MARSASKDRAYTIRGWRGGQVRKFPDHVLLLPLRTTTRYPKPPPALLNLMLLKRSSTLNQNSGARNAKIAFYGHVSYPPCSTTSAPVVSHTLSEHLKTHGTQLHPFAEDSRV